MKYNNELNKKNFTDEENKLIKKYIEEYNDLYQKILILSEHDFIENITKRVEIISKSKFKHFSQNSIKSIEKFIKDNIYIPDFKFASIIKKNIINRTKREKALHYFRGEIIPHCTEDKKDDYYIHICGERFQIFRYKSNNGILLNNINSINNNQGMHYDYILFCIKCNMIYKSTLIQFKCFANNIEFYSKLLINNDDSSKLYKNTNNCCYATWKKYHCNAIINDTMKCDICKESYIFYQDKKLLYCPKCKTTKNPLDITWKCIICQKEFQTEAKIYNPLEYKSLKICVKNTIVNKIKAKPEYMACKCNIDINCYRFFHKSICKGELYLGEINSQKVVVCAKCDTLGLYEGYIWTCPKCMKRFKTKKRQGSVCTKLGLIDSINEKNETNSKINRNLSEKNNKKYVEIKNNLNDINNNLNDQNNYTISNQDNDILNYLNDIKDSMMINNKNNLNIINNNKDNSSNINKKRMTSQTFQKTAKNSFIENKNNQLTNHKINNLSFSEKCISDIYKMKADIEGNSFNEQYENNILNGFSQKDMISKEKENSNDSKIKRSRYIINNYKKKNNFYIKNNFQLKTESKEKDIDYSNFQKENKPLALIKTKTMIEKNQSESKDKNILRKYDFIKQNDENNIINPRKVFSYRKPYYSINNSFIKGFQNEDNQLNENRMSEIIIKKSNNDLFINENKDNDIPYNTINDKDISDSINEDDNKVKGKLYSAIEDTKKKYNKRSNCKKYLYKSKDDRNTKSKIEKKIVAKTLYFGEMKNKDIVDKNDNSKLNKNIIFRKNNNININININNSSNNINANNENIDEIIKQKRMFSKSIIMNNLTINDKNNVINSLNIGHNKNNIKKSKTAMGKNINNINNINTNININNINNNLHYYNQIDNTINYINNSIISNRKKNINYPISYKKKINNRNSESTTLESEKLTKNNKNNNINNINTLNKNDNINNNRDNKKYLLNQKYTNFSKYKIIKQIGKGTFGQIFMVENNQHQYFALKKLIATSLKDIKTIEHEYQILVDLQSHGKKINLVQIYGIETKQLDPTTFVMYVLMELASTDWEKEILTRHNLNKYYKENELMNIISSLITTFAQLQKEKISHRDIKPQNILIFQDSKTYKLADFGEAKELLSDDRPTERQTLRGTELYMSPILFYALRSRQLIKYVKHNPYKSDLFSFGLCCLFASTLCFESIYDVRELRNNTAIKYIIQKYLRNRYSNVVINIICSMLDVNENSRNDFIEMEKEIKKIGY